MADSKYGRLFTQDDVEGLLDRVVNQVVQATASDDELERVQEAVNRARASFDMVDPIKPGDSGSRFPEDEPLFLLRGQDLFAPFAIDAYAGRLHELGDVGLANEVGEAASSVRAWQRENPGRVKLPD